MQTLEINCMTSFAPPVQAAVALDASAASHQAAAGEAVASARAPE
jgi:hypothetical protein